MRRLLFICFLCLPVLQTYAKNEKCPPLESANLNQPLKSAACFSTSFQSSSLGKAVQMNVILPPGYSAKSGAAMPYAVFLHGRGGDRYSLIYTDGVESLDNIVKKGEQPFLIFTPNGDTSYWMNRALTKERYGDMVAKDLVSYVEQNYRVIKNTPCERALFGMSMGGNGSVQLSFNYPNVFCNVFAMSPIFRRPQDIWTPGSNSPEPHDDYYSYGTGKDYEARSPRHLCEIRKQKGSDHCLPMKNFRLEIGSADPLLDKFPDTRIFMEELKKSHPEFQIGIKDCDDKAVCSASKDCNAHAGSYWACRMPDTMTWISEQFKKEKHESH